jgi:hypothetical protein
MGKKREMRVFENRMLRRIFVPKKDEVTGGGRKLHNEELHNVYSSPYIIRVIKSRRIMWAGHVARMGEMRNAYNILYLRQIGFGVWTGFVWLRTVTVVDSCEHGNKLSGNFLTS